MRNTLHSTYLLDLTFLPNFYFISGNFKIARHFLPDSVCRLLVPLELGVVHELPLGVDGVIVRVGLIDANHVHGAIMFVFQVSRIKDHQRQLF